MSMTRGEAIAELQACVDAWDRWVPANGSLADKNTQAVKMALAALRPVSRERVEKVWGGCGWCEEEWGTCDPITNRFTMPPRGGIRFCPMCGRPLTDEAVEMVMARLEALKDAD